MPINSYSLEFILHTGENESCSVIKNYLIEWAQDLEITEESPEPSAKGKNFKVRMKAQDPTVIFDACAQLGRIKSVKIEERG